MTKEPKRFNYIRVIPTRRPTIKNIKRYCSKKDREFYLRLTGKRIAKVRYEGLERWVSDCMRRVLLNDHNAPDDLDQIPPKMEADLAYIFDCPEVLCGCKADKPSVIKIQTLIDLWKRILQQELTHLEKISKLISHQKRGEHQ